jgi:Second Messenger Oligonucleotide or Dinucleotide Synthetase domain
MLTVEQKNQFSEILEELGKTLDITETQYKAAVKSYEAVGTWLSKEDSSLAPYKPEILPQGSFMMGTMVKPENEHDDLDIDLVCQLKGKRPEWTQYDLKNKVGDRLKANEIYQEMLDEEGRRCWTLIYSDDANYHLDILPSIVSNDYRMILEKAFSSIELKDIDKLAIRLTCKEEFNYTTSTNPDEWLKSNPFGYGRWFFQQATLDFVKAFSISESIKPVPTYQKEKLPLQRVVQILKRHRDMMFCKEEDKRDRPISIIITTLAGKAYKKETNIIDALLNVIEQIPYHIEDHYSPKHGKKIKWITNPVNDEENFADRWVEHPEKQENFYNWMKQVSIDIENALGKRGLQYIQESLEKPFGKNDISKAFSNYGEILLKKREDGAMKMAAGTGILGITGRTNIPQHKPFGKNE